MHKLTAKNRINNPLIHRNDGVTLVELLAVIVIMGIITAIAVVSIGALINRTQAKANEQVIHSLNEATRLYSISEGVSTSEMFDDMASNGERISLLFSEGYLSSLPQPLPPTSFSWDIPTQEWVLIDLTEDPPAPTSINYDFSVSRLVDVVEDGGIITTGSFTDTGSSIDSGYGLLFIDNSKTDYTISVESQLSSGTTGGYGIFFETTLDGSNKDTGYILQYDRSYSNGEILIRPRTNGSEGAPVVRFSVLFDNGGSGDWVLTGGVKNNQNPWWTTTHTMKLVITTIDTGLNTKTIDVYVDDTLIIHYSFTSSILASQVDLNQTGFRAWGVTTHFYGISVIS